MRVFSSIIIRGDVRWAKINIRIFFEDWKKLHVWWKDVTVRHWSFFIEKCESTLMLNSLSLHKVNSEMPCTSCTDNDGSTDNWSSAWLELSNGGILDDKNFVPPRRWKVNLLLYKRSSWYGQLCLRGESHLRLRSLALCSMEFKKAELVWKTDVHFTWNEANWCTQGCF